jgi:hypothetical protein
MPMEEIKLLIYSMQDHLVHCSLLSRGKTLAELQMRYQLILQKCGRWFKSVLDSTNNEKVR